MLKLVSDHTPKDLSLGDDESLDFQRIGGNAGSATVVFLPWCMPFKLAVACRIVPANYRACYEMPRAIVSSDPETCIRALHMVVDDATRDFQQSGLDASEIVVVGLSIGNAAATMFANRIGARLCSIASADRGDLTLWESPASRHVKVRAEEKGFRVSDFTAALRGNHTIDNLANLAPGSRFIVGMRDELLPQQRRDGLLTAVRRVLPVADIIHIDATHFGTMREAIRRGLCESAEMTPAKACSA
jgi:pimeloyl-ACP methyl ester carboxylesterase